MNSKLLPNVYITLGHKGGVGKSVVALTLVELLRLAGRKVLYFETDTDNPDVFLALEEDPRNPGIAADGVSLHLMRIDQEEDWLNAINLIAEHPEHSVVIGTASRTADSVSRHAPLLQETMDTLARELVAFWVTDGDASSLGQLVEHLKVFPKAKTHVVKNSAIGPEVFAGYDSSELRKSIDTRGGQSLIMPRLNSCVAQRLRSTGEAARSEHAKPFLSIAQGLATLPLAHKTALSMFLRRCGQTFAPVLH